MAYELHEFDWHLHNEDDPNKPHNNIGDNRHLHKSKVRNGLDKVFHGNYHTFGH